MTEDIRDMDFDIPQSADSPRAQRRRGSRNGSIRNVVVLSILVVLLVISGSVMTYLYFKLYRADQQTNPDVSRAVLAAASDGTVAMLSYSPESLDRDFANAKSYLTGDFLSYYSQFSEQIVGPAAREKSLKTTASVMGAALAELHPESAVVLVFVDQSTTSKEKPEPSIAASTVLVSMKSVNGKWLITKFNAT